MTARTAGDAAAAVPRRAANRLQTFDESRDAIDRLYQSALTAKGDTAFFEFLDFAKRFSHMAVFNAMMVKVQRPGSLLAATRKQWKQIGRMPSPDAVPIVTLRSFGPLSFVYDLEDTSGKPLPSGHPNPFQAIGGATDRDFCHLSKAAKSNGVMVEQTDQYGTGLAGTAAGFLARPESARGADGPDVWWRVRLNAKHTPAVQIATLAHELGHVYCGHIGTHPKGNWPDRRRVPHAQAEFEAEAVAWLVCKRRGIEPNSPDYLRTHVRNMALKDVSLWIIYSAANRVEAGVTTPRSHSR